MDLSMYGKHFLHHISFKGKKKNERKKTTKNFSRERKCNKYVLSDEQGK